jgi:magnesium transporter
VFKGVVSVRRLLISDSNEVMKELVSGENKATASPSQDILEIAALMTKYNLTSVAVLDENKKMLGVITVDDVMRHFVPHA